MNADSVKARLTNFVVSSGCTFQMDLIIRTLNGIHVKDAGNSQIVNKLLHLL